MVASEVHYKADKVYNKRYFLTYVLFNQFLQMTSVKHSPKTNNALTIRP